MPHLRILASLLAIDEPAVVQQLSSLNERIDVIPGGAPPISLLVVRRFGQLIGIESPVVPQIFEAIPAEKAYGRQRRKKAEIVGVEAQFETMPQAPAKRHQEICGPPTVKSSTAFFSGRRIGWRCAAHQFSTHSIVMVPCIRVALPVVASSVSTAYWKVPGMVKQRPAESWLASLETKRYLIPEAVADEPHVTD